MSTQAALKPLEAGKLKVELSKTPKPLTANKDLVFGRTFSDHMLFIEWDNKTGWHDPLIKPYQKLSLEPSSVVLHYAFECFEGMKAYKDKKGQIRLFRPDMNMARLNASAERIELPTVSGPDLIECIKQLVKTDERWIPNERGYSLYIRPTLIGTQEFLGVGPTDRALLFVITSPVGPYYRTGFNAVRLLATTEFVRAWPRGTGSAKIGANYVPTIKPQVLAAKQGYQQNLWLFGDDHQLTEVGTMNLFVLWKSKSGETELVTPPLDGSILAGVTRDSIIKLTKKWNEFKVSERHVTMPQLAEAVKEKRVLEVFGAGTAAIVSPVKAINYLGEDLVIPLDPKDPNSQAGPVAKRLNDTIMNIQYGEIEHEWSVIVS